MISVKFYCRDCKVGKDGYAPIEVAINIDGKRIIKTLPIPKEQPTTFNKLIRARKANDLQMVLDGYRDKINKIMHRQIIVNDTIDINLVMVELLGNNIEVKKEYTLKQLIEDYYKHCLNKVGDITIKTANRYRSTGNVLIEYFGDIPIDTINKGMMDDLLVELKKKYEQSSLSSIWRKGKTMFEYAYNHQRISHNPFNGYKISRGEKDVEYLTVEEVEKIQNKTFATERLNRVRDIFIFACNTAISFCDLNNITKENIEVINGVVMYVNKRNKTNVTFYTPLNKVALSILERYNYKLPIRSNQNYNAYLKEIGDICGIDKKMHSHIARHTAATMMLNNGIPIEIVSKVLGHTNITQTQHYAKLTANRVAQAFQ